MHIDIESYADDGPAVAKLPLERAIKALTYHRLTKALPFWGAIALEMALIYEAEGRALTRLEIGRAAIMAGLDAPSPNTLGAACAYLEENGFMVTDGTVAKPGAGRPAAILKLTDKGRSYAQSLEKASDKASAA